jgi:hypothetical protein
MGSIALQESEINIEFDIQDELILVSLNHGGVTVQTALTQDEYAALLGEMQRIGVALGLGG